VRKTADGQIQHTALTTLIDRRGIRRVDYTPTNGRKKKFSGYGFPRFLEPVMTSIYGRILLLILALCLARGAEAAEIKELSKFELKITARPSATFRQLTLTVGEILISPKPDSSFGKAAGKA